LFEPVFVPGLLQTREYTMTILEGTYGFPPERCSRIANLRSARQEVLRSDRPPRFVCFIDEAVIARPVGSSAMMRDQLARMREVAQDRNVDLRLVAFSGGVNPGMMGPFVQVYLPLDDGDDGAAAVYVENSAREFFAITDPDERATYSRAFNILAASALTPAETVAVLEARIADLR